MWEPTIRQMKLYFRFTINLVRFIKYNNPNCHVILFSPLDDGKLDED